LVISADERVDCDEGARNAEVPRQRADGTPVAAPDGAIDVPAPQPLCGMPDDGDDVKRAYGRPGTAGSTADGKPHEAP